MKISEEAMKAAEGIGHYCGPRFEADVEPLLDIPWFAEKVQTAIDAAVEKSRRETDGPTVTELFDAAVELAQLFEPEYIPEAGDMNGEMEEQSERVFVSYEFDRLRKAIEAMISER